MSQTPKAVLKTGLKKVILMGAIFLFLGPHPAFAQKDEVTELQEKLEALAEEVEALKEAEEEGIEKKIHFHGYGELHYNSTTQEGANDKMDFHRMVIGLEYPFNDWIVFDSEVDFEHAGSANELELEYAHLSFLLFPAFNLRMGSMLMPVGYLNEFHEPPLFYSVERPHVQKHIIPTTWMEGGAGIFGRPSPEMGYRLYLVGGLDASNFTASSGIRGGRGKVKDALADDLAVVGRVEYDGISDIRLGASGYLGDAAQGDSSLGRATVSILEGDLRYRWKDLELTGLIAFVGVEDTGKINTATAKVIGEEMLGWYVEGAYHLGRSFMPDEQDIVLFARHEQFDTQKDVATGLAASAANDRKVTTVGMAYYPIPQIAIKADLEDWEDGTGADWHQFNMGVGFMY